jgi:hypothetical protein
MQPSRLPRFKRSSVTAPLELTARDRTIIQSIHQHRFIRSSHLSALLGGSSQGIVRRLQLLYHHGYLERPRCQLDYYHRGGSRHIVYGIGTQGAALLKRELGLALHASRWGEKNRSVGRIFLEHALLVSEVMVAIELACRRNGHIRLLVDDQLPSPIDTGGDRPSFRWSISLNQGLKLGVIPDRVFGLEYFDVNGNRDCAFFFLEADQGTMPVRRQNLYQTSFYRKLLAYEATWSQSIHRTRFGFHRFRVITVTTSVERARSLVEACSKLKSGHGLFLFTDQRSLETGDVFSSIWQTSRHGQSSSLLP